MSDTDRCPTLENGFRLYDDTCGLLLDIPSAANMVEALCLADNWICHLRAAGWWKGFDDDDEVIVYHYVNGESVSCGYVTHERWRANIEGLDIDWLYDVFYGIHSSKIPEVFFPKSNHEANIKCTEVAPETLWGWFDRSREVANA